MGWHELFWMSYWKESQYFVIFLMLLFIIIFFKAHKMHLYNLILMWWNCSRVTIQITTKKSTDVINDFTNTIDTRICSSKDILNTLQPMNLSLSKIQMFIKWQFYLFMFKLYLKFNYHPISPAFMQSDTAFKISL